MAACRQRPQTSKPNTGHQQKGCSATSMPRPQRTQGLADLDDGGVAVVAHGAVVGHLQALQVLDQAALQVACTKRPPGAVP